MTALDPSEAVLWRGKPVRFPVFHRSDKLFAPYSVLFAAFIAYFFVVPTWNGGRAIDRTMAVVLIALALYQLVGRLAVRQVVLRGTEYVITDRHVAVESTLFGRTRTRAHRLDRLDPPAVSAAEDGTGSITFGATSMFDAVSRRADQPPELQHVADVRQVRDLIAEAQRETMTGGR